MEAEEGNMSRGHESEKLDHESDEHDEVSTPPRLRSTTRQYAQPSPSPTSSLRESQALTDHGTTLLVRAEPLSPPRVVQPVTRPPMPQRPASAALPSGKFANAFPTSSGTPIFPHHGNRLPQGKHTDLLLGLPLRAVTGTGLDVITTPDHHRQESSSSKHKHRPQSRNSSTSGSGSHRRDTVGPSSPRARRSTSPAAVLMESPSRHRKQRLTRASRGQSSDRGTASANKNSGNASRVPATAGASTVSPHGPRTSLDRSTGSRGTPRRPASGLASGSFALSATAMSPARQLFAAQRELGILAEEVIARHATRPHTLTRAAQGTSPRGTRPHSRPPSHPVHAAGVKPAASTSRTATSPVSRKSGSGSRSPHEEATLASDTEDACVAGTWAAVVPDRCYTDELAKRLRDISRSVRRNPSGARTRLDKNISTTLLTNNHVNSTRGGGTASGTRSPPPVATMEGGGGGGGGVVSASSFAVQYEHLLQKLLSPDKLSRRQDDGDGSARFTSSSPPSPLPDAAATASHRRSSPGSSPAIGNQRGTPSPASTPASRTPTRSERRHHLRTATGRHGKRSKPSSPAAAAGTSPRRAPSPPVPFAEYEALLALTSTVQESLARVRRQQRHAQLQKLQFATQLRAILTREDGREHREKASDLDEGGCERPEQRETAAASSLASSSASTSLSDALRALSPIDKADPAAEKKKDSSNSSRSGINSVPGSDKPETMLRPPPPMPNRTLFPFQKESADLSSVTGGAVQLDEADVRRAVDAARAAIISAGQRKYSLPDPATKKTVTRDTHLEEEEEEGEEEDPIVLDAMMWRGGDPENPCQGSGNHEAVGNGRNAFRSPRGSVATTVAGGEMFSEADPMHRASLLRQPQDSVAEAAAFTAARRTLHKQEDAFFFQRLLLSLPDAFSVEATEAAVGSGFAPFRCVPGAAKGSLPPRHGFAGLLVNPSDDTQEMLLKRVSVQASGKVRRRSEGLRCVSRDEGGDAHAADAMPLQDKDTAIAFLGLTADDIVHGALTDEAFLHHRQRRRTSTRRSLRGSRTYTDTVPLSEHAESAPSSSPQPKRRSRWLEEEASSAQAPVYTHHGPPITPSDTFASTLENEALVAALVHMYHARELAHTARRQKRRCTLQAELDREYAEAVKAAEQRRRAAQNAALLAEEKIKLRNVVAAAKERIAALQAEAIVLGSLVESEETALRRAEVVWAVNTAVHDRVQDAMAASDEAQDNDDADDDNDDNDDNDDDAHVASEEEDEAASSAAVADREEDNGEETALPSSLPVTLDRHDKHSDEDSITDEVDVYRMALERYQQQQERREGEESNDAGHLAAASSHALTFGEILMQEKKAREAARRRRRQPKPSPSAGRESASVKSTPGRRSSTVGRAIATAYKIPSRPVTSPARVARHAAHQRLRPPRKPTPPPVRPCSQKGRRANLPPPPPPPPPGIRRQSMPLPVPPQPPQRPQLFFPTSAKRAVEGDAVSSAPRRDRSASVFIRATTPEVVCAPVDPLPAHLLCASRTLPSTKRLIEYYSRVH